MAKVYSDSEKAAYYYQLHQNCFNKALSDIYWKFYRTYSILDSVKSELAAYRSSNPVFKPPKKITIV
ncbi:hypothetical protein DBR40_19955 [Pedobacter sp. KBW01]|uniref:hypothetical protein n=1 Tax=Pedobacter sp. KBW01 TaxID=2153364 RepID=UPI000F598953|nr:hypothetical protein [Pedobacter sp. KBW01]RQO68518.1 hypothetical protein DBR40_19955 [Pedobacter sp. KBW01]